MKTMIDAMQTGSATTNTETTGETRNSSSLREHMLTWLIVVVSVVMAVQVFRTVALQSEVNQSLDRLYQEAGQALPVKS